MAKFDRKDWKNYYISRSVFTDVFSRALCQPNWRGDKADNPSRKAMDEWDQVRVTHLQHAVRKIIQYRQLKPIYDLTATFVLRSPRYRLLDLLDIIANPELDPLTADEQEAIKHTKKFYQLLTDNHAKYGFEPGVYGDRVSFTYDADDIAKPATLITNAEGSLYQLDDGQLVDFNDYQWWPVDAIAQQMHHLKTATLIDLLLKSDLRMRDLKYASADGHSQNRLVPMLNLSDIQDTMDTVTVKLKNYGSQFIDSLSEDGDHGE